MCHLDTGGMLHIWTQGTCDTMFKIYANLNRTKFQHREAIRAHNATPSWRNSKSSYLLGEEISVFSKSIATISWPHSNQRPHILEYLDSTNRLWWGEKTQNWVEKKGNTDLGRVQMKGSECVQNYYIKFLKY